MLQCGSIIADDRPRWISAATRLAGRHSWELTGACSPGRLPGGNFHQPQIAAGASSQSMNIETRPADFTDEQKRYLEGFATGLQISKAGRGFGGTTAGKPNHEAGGPDAAHIKA